MPTTKTNNITIVGDRLIDHDTGYTWFRGWVNHVCSGCRKEKYASHEGGSRSFGDAGSWTYTLCKSCADEKMDRIRIQRELEEYAEAYPDGNDLAG
jgi:hypothetical protein